jgi:ribosomal protein S18 acetylase RimI-like enzyme
MGTPGRAWRVIVAVEMEQSTAAIRDAEADDASGIAAIGADAFRLLHQDWFDAITIEAIIDQIYSVESLEACIACCRGSGDAQFLVAYSEDRLAGFLHYDSFGPEPELHRIYVRPDVKRAGFGTALMSRLHDRMQPGQSYVLLVAAANEPALAFYRRHGLYEKARVDGLQFFRDHMGVELPPNPPRVAAVVMAYAHPVR